MSRDFFGRPAAVGIIVRDDDKILLVKRAKHWKTGEYCTPGGHVEGKETLRQAAQRELKEETGLDVNISDLKFVHTSHINSHPGVKDDPEYLDFHFEAKVTSGVAVNAEPDAHSEITWMTMDEMKSAPVVDYIYEALKLIEAGETYSEFGW